MSNEHPLGITAFDLSKKYLGFTPLLNSFSNSWGSNLSNFRSALRIDLEYQLRNLNIYNEDWEKALDLSQRPLFSSVNISISHTLQVGGYMVAPKNICIGLDIEVTERVKPEILGRVSTPNEITSTPDYGALWVAKEASYKALPDTLQPPTISNINITNWESLSNSNTFRFTFISKEINGLIPCGSGVVEKKSCLNLGIATFNP